MDQIVHSSHSFYFMKCRKYYWRKNFPLFCHNMKTLTEIKFKDNVPSVHITVIDTWLRIDNRILQWFHKIGSGMSMMK